MPDLATSCVDFLDQDCLKHLWNTINRISTFADSGSGTLGQFIVAIISYVCGKFHADLGLRGNMLAIAVWL